MSPSRHPDDSDWLPNTVEWRRRVIEILEDPSNEWNRSSLATAIGCKPTQMTKLLNGTTKSSPLIRRISEKLAIAQLEPYVVDPRLRGIIEMFLELDSDEDIAFIEKAIRMAKH